VASSAEATVLSPVVRKLISENGLKDRKSVV
jgi:hypothetical protein